MSDSDPNQTLRGRASALPQLRPAVGVPTSAVLFRALRRSRTLARGSLLRPGGGGRRGRRCRGRRDRRGTIVAARARTGWTDRRAFPIHPCRIHRRAQVAQVVEQRTENPRVGGSTPSLGTTIFPPEPIVVTALGTAIWVAGTRQRQPPDVPSRAALRRLRNPRARS